MLKEVLVFVVVVCFFKGMLALKGMLDHRRCICSE